MSDIKKINNSGSRTHIKDVLTPVVKNIVEPSDIIIEGDDSSFFSKPGFLKSAEEKENKAKKDLEFDKERIKRWEALVDNIVGVISDTIIAKKELLSQERTGRIFKDPHPISVEIATNLMKSESIAKEIRKKAKSVAEAIADETIIQKLVGKVDSALNDDILKQIKDAVVMGAHNNGAKAEITGKVIVNAKLSATNIKLADDDGKIAPPANLLAAKPDTSGSKISLG